MTAGTGERFSVAHLAGLFLSRAVLDAAMRVDKIRHMIDRGQPHRFCVALVTAIRNIDLRVAGNTLRHSREIRLRRCVRRLDSVMALRARPKLHVLFVIKMRNGGNARFLD
jgi:hypothetical protein